MWNCPINGSQVNSPAKLYKRFTGEAKVTAKESTEVITIEDNREAGIQRVRKKSLVDFATVFLPIRRLM